MKAQMFVVTAIFLATMLFTVQQMFITYAQIDVSEPFDTKQVYVLRSIIGSVNDTIRDSGSCQEFQQNLEMLLDEIKFDVSREGYLMNTQFGKPVGQPARKLSLPAPSGGFQITAPV